MNRQTKLHRPEPETRNPFTDTINRPDWLQVFIIVGTFVLFGFFLK